MSRQYRGQRLPPVPPHPHPAGDDDALAAAPVRSRGMLAADAKAASSAPHPLQTEPDRAYIRLELLRLAHRHDQDSAQIVERAKTLEAYVLGDQPADKF